MDELSRRYRSIQNLLCLIMPARLNSEHKLGERCGCEKILISFRAGLTRFSHPNFINLRCLFQKIFRDHIQKIYLRHCVV